MLNNFMRQIYTISSLTVAIHKMQILLALQNDQHELSFENNLKLVFGWKNLSPLHCAVFRKWFHAFHFILTRWLFINTLEILHARIARQLNLAFRPYILSRVQNLHKFFEQIFAVSSWHLVLANTIIMVRGTKCAQLLRQKIHNGRW